MKTKLALLALPFLLPLPALGSQVSVNFEATNYVLNQGVGGKTDPSSGTVWNASGTTNLIVNWQGSQALKLDLTNSTGSAVSLQNVVGVVGFNPPDHLVKVSFDYAFGGAPNLWDSSSLRIGGNAYNPNGASWMDIRLSGHTFYLIRQKSDGSANEPIELTASAAKYTNLVSTQGQFVHIAFELDTLNNTYTSLTFAGTGTNTNKIYDATSLVAGWKLPFGTNSADPTATYLMISSISSNSSHYVDNILVIPEPSTWTFVSFGFVVLALFVGARHRKLARAKLDSQA